MKSRLVSSSKAAFLLVACATAEDKESFTLNPFCEGPGCGAVDSGVGQSGAGGHGGSTPVASTGGMAGLASVAEAGPPDGMDSWDGGGVDVDAGTADAGMNPGDSGVDAGDSSVGVDGGAEDSGASGSAGEGGMGGEAGAGGAGGDGGNSGGAGEGGSGGAPEPDPQCGDLAIPSPATWSADASHVCATNPPCTAPNTPYSPSKAFDSLLTTSFKTGKLQAGDEWFELDLGAVATVSRIVTNTLASPGDYPRHWVIRVGVDAPPAQDDPILVEGDGTTDLTPMEFPAPVNARYILISQTGVSTTRWWSIHNLTVHCD